MTPANTARSAFLDPREVEFWPDCKAMQLTTDDGLTFLVYGAEPGSTSAQALALLTSWAATDASDWVDGHTGTSAVP